MKNSSNDNANDDKETKQDSETKHKCYSNISKQHF